MSEGYSSSRYLAQSKTRERREPSSVEAPLLRRRDHGEEYIQVPLLVVYILCCLYYIMLVIIWVAIIIWNKYRYLNLGILYKIFDRGWQGTNNTGNNMHNNLIWYMANEWPFCISVSTQMSVRIVCIWIRVMTEIECIYCVWLTDLYCNKSDPFRQTDWPHSKALHSPIFWCSPAKIIKW